jgi:hypothetical protein
MARLLKPTHRQIAEQFANDQDEIFRNANEYITTTPFTTLNVPKVGRQSIAPDIGYVYQGTPENIGKYFGSRHTVKHRPAFDSVRSANMWIRKRGLQNPARAFETDIDGDDIKDVIVLDRNQPVAINGYILSDPDFSYRQGLADYKARIPYSSKIDYINDTYRPHYDHTTRQLIYNDMYDQAMQIPGLRKHLPKQNASLLFYHKIFAPIYNDATGDDMELRKAIPALVTSNLLFKDIVSDPILKPLLSNEGLVNQIIAKLQKQNKSITDGNIIKNMRASKEYKAYTKARIIDDANTEGYQQSVLNYLQARVNELEPHIGDKATRIKRRDDVMNRYVSNDEYDLNQQPNDVFDQV